MFNQSQCGTGPFRLRFLKLNLGPELFLNVTADTLSDQQEPPARVTPKAKQQIVCSPEKPIHVLVATVTVGIRGGVSHTQSEVKNLTGRASRHTNLESNDNLRGKVSK